MQDNFFKQHIERYRRDPDGFHDPGDEEQPMSARQHPTQNSPCRQPGPRPARILA